MTKLEQPILRIYDQKQSILPNQIQLSTMDFFVNPPEGADHSLKCVESKIRRHFYYKNFSK